MEFDVSAWEADDAVDGEGGKFDLKLDASFDIVGRDPDRSSVAS